MSEEHIKADIAAYLSHGLAESRRREVEAHVRECERCRHALDKVRAKQSRQRRQALKTAQPNGPTNLFLNRLSKQEGVESESTGGPWLWLGLILVVGAGIYFASHYGSRWRGAIPPISSGPPVAVSTETVTETVKVAPAAVPISSTTTLAVAHPIRVAEVHSSSLTAETADTPETPETPRFWSGTDSGVKDSREVIVNGRSAWHTLWAEMGRAEAAPRVNFNTTVVVGVFAGEKPSAGFTVLLKDPQEEEESNLMAYSVSAPPPSAPMPPLLTHPYALRTIPRGSKPVRFLEENTVGSTPTKETTP